MKLSRRFKQIWLPLTAFSVAFLALFFSGILPTPETTASQAGYLFLFLACALNLLITAGYFFFVKALAFGMVRKIWFLLTALGMAVFAPLYFASGLIVEFDMAYARYRPTPATVQIYYEPERSLHFDGVWEHESVKIPLPNEKRGEIHIRVRLPWKFTQPGLRGIRVDYLNVPGKVIISNFTVRDALTRRLLAEQIQGDCRPRCLIIEIPTGNCLEYQRECGMADAGLSGTARDCVRCGAHQTRSIRKQDGKLFLETTLSANDPWLYLDVSNGSPHFLWWRVVAFNFLIMMGYILIRALAFGIRAVRGRGQGTVMP